jgi:hypothetical protein
MSFTRQFKPSQLKDGLYNITASNAVTASYALSSATTEPSYLIITGSVFAQVDTKNDIFLIKSGSKTMLTVTQSGVIILSTQSVELTGPAPAGGIYFTSSSLFVGLEI